MANAETLFGLYRDRVFRYLYRASGHLDTAHELTQEVFLRVSRAAVPAGADADLAAWLFRIARNIVLDHKRRLDRQPRAASVESCYLTTPAAQETAAAVNQALATLPHVDRDVFLLREVAGLGYDEIARTCDLTCDAVRNRIYRARLALRERLAAPIAHRRLEPMGRRREES